MKKSGCGTAPYLLALLDQGQCQQSRPKLALSVGKVFVTFLALVCFPLPISSHLRMRDAPQGVADLQVALNRTPPFPLPST